MAKMPSAWDEAAEAIAEYVADFYECLAQIEMAKRRLTDLKERISADLGALADRLTEDERHRLFAAFYWDAPEVHCEPVLSGFDLRSVNRLAHVLRDPIGVPCLSCGTELIAKSRTHRQTILGCAAHFNPKHWNRDLYCSDCIEPARISHNRAWDEERDRKQQAEYRRLAELRSMPYPLYLRSPEWQETRAKALKRSRYRCQLCGVNQWVTLDVHHSTYERLGQELPADLIVLCRQCHAKHHTELPEPQA